MTRTLAWICPETDDAYFDRIRAVLLRVAPSEDPHGYIYMLVPPRRCVRSRSFLITFVSADRTPQVLRHQLEPERRVAADRLRRQGRNSLEPPVQDRSW